ncbi:MAG: GNAT family N-acetyltransferase [Rhodospirillaceae bacterium]|nr:GNAT family N-acetyltransferase [Rhodospirillaceae bacterium]
MTDITSPGSIRDATEDDMEAVAAIYGHYVETSAATFEVTIPTVSEMTRRFQDLTQGYMPYIVAEQGGVIAGYAYTGLYRTRWGYRYTVEDSVYVGQKHLGKGIGRSLLEDLIAKTTGLGYRQMISVIGDSANAASIALHSQLGFKVIGALPSTGRKFDRWIDSVLMQRSLGDGNTTPPTGLTL